MNVKKFVVDGLKYCNIICVGYFKGVVNVILEFFWKCWIWLGEKFIFK